MFALGFLIAGVLFLGCIILLSKLLPKGKPRFFFVVAVVACAFAYPYLYLIRPSYAEFQQLCLQPSPPTILKTKPVDFILIESGYRSDCSTGPAFIAGTDYLGFDCRKGGDDAFYRYTKKPGADQNCGLECFDVATVAVPESSFGFTVRDHRTRRGYVVDGEKKVAVEFPHPVTSKEIPFWQWLRFDDAIHVDETEGEMAHATNYSYLPYGPIAILGLASGMAPSLSCPKSLEVDPRTVYPPKKSSGSSSGMAKG